MSYASEILNEKISERILSDRQKQSKESMIALGREYLESAEKLKQRVKELKSDLDCMPLNQRKRAEMRIELLEQEIREAKKIGAEAVTFYEPSHRFLPRQNRKSVYPGAYLC